jgi:Secretion system C-terminal sorting domain/Ig-like domain CHU_C associated
LYPKIKKLKKMKKLLHLLFAVFVSQFSSAQTLSSVSVNTATSTATTTNITFRVNPTSPSNARIFYAVAPAVATTGNSALYTANPITSPAVNGFMDLNIAATGLTPNTTYNYQLQLFNPTTGAVVRTADGTFTTLALPTLTGVGSSGVTSTSATINFTIDPNNKPTTPVLSYGTSASLGTNVSGTAFTGTNPTAGTIALTNLDPATTYHYSLNANSLAGSAGATAIQTFTTLAAPNSPTVSAVSSSAVGATTATINYSINANGFPTTVIRIRYGTDNTNLDRSLICPQVTGTTTTAQSQQLTGLTAGRTYFYRVEATNSQGSALIQPSLTFTTTSASAVPVISAVSTGTVGETTATINYSINANGSSTNPRIVYSSTFPTLNFTENLPVVTGNTTTVLTHQLTNLQSNKTYTYSIEATNAAGVAIASSPIQFTTLAPASTQPVANSPQTFCNSATVANLDAFGTAIKWYAAATGGSPLATTTALASGTYYVTQTQTNRSESARVAIQVIISVVGAPTGASAQTFVQGATIANLVANGVGSVVWYASSANATANVNALATTTLLTNNTAYFAVLQTVAGCRSTTPLAVTVSLTPATTAPAITALTTASVVPSFESAQVNFNLNAFGSATTYVVEYTRDVIGTWTPITGGTTSVASSTAFSVQIPGLRSLERYFVRVRATNASNQITVSNEVSFTTLNPIAVTNLGTSNITATTAQINYTLNTNGFNAFVEIRYQASATFDSGNPFTRVTVSNFTLNNTSPTNYNFTLTGLASNTVYSYEFGAITNNNGNFEGGQNAAFRTSTLSTNDFDAKNLQFNIYPNPAINVVNIEVASELKSVEVYSLQGQKIKSTSSKELNVSDLSSGVYMIRVEDTNGAIATKRLLKK